MSTMSEERIDVAGLRRAVSGAITSGSWSAVESWCARNCTFVFDQARTGEEGALPDELVGMIVELLADDSFLLSKGASNLLLVLDYEWGRLSAPQRARLLRPLVLAYERFVDPLAWFVVAELLGRFFASPAALEALGRLRIARKARARASVAVGLGYLARGAGGRSLARAARAMLAEMTEDRAKLVRQEAQAELARLARTGTAAAAD
jgi:hypothetical protein